LRLDSDVEGNDMEDVGASAGVSWDLGLSDGPYLANARGSSAMDFVTVIKHPEDEHIPPTPTSSTPFRLSSGSEASAQSYAAHADPFAPPPEGAVMQRYADASPRFKNFRFPNPSRDRGP
jgi:hypothetical protein